MNISEEELIAYADGEYDAPERLAERLRIEESLRADPDLAKRVEQHRALRQRLGMLYAEVLTEPVPERLVVAARSAPATRPNAEIVDLDRVRLSRQASAADGVPRIRQRFSRWGAIAASLTVGLVAGYLAWGPREPVLFTTSNGQLTAQSSLAHALMFQTVGQQTPSQPEHVGLSFKSKSGEYCRTFVMRHSESLAGLACRHGQQWRIDALVRTEAPPAGLGAYRPAGSELPDSVRSAVEAQIVGEPLDAREEALAIRNNWN